MRIKSSLNRESETKEVLPKLFVMMEGTDTEPLYFEAYFSRVSNVEFLPFERSGADLGWSNPYLLMKELKMELNPSSIGLTYRDFLPFLIRHLRANNSVLDVGAFKKAYFQKIKRRGINWRTEPLSEPVFESILGEIKQTSFINLVYTDLASVKKDFSDIIGDKTYDAHIDRIVLIADRDKDSFTEAQFDSVIKIGAENGIGVYITNPCFEFFLLLHFCDARHLDEGSLRENTKTDDKTFAHNELLRFDPSFTKESFDTALYLAKVDTAKNNLRLYEENLSSLKNSVGSNLRLFLEQYPMEAADEKTDLQ